jgi:hypothetical protein
LIEQFRVSGIRQNDHVPKGVQGRLEQPVSTLDGQLRVGGLGLPDRIEPAAQDFLDHDDRDGLLVNGNQCRALW